MILIVVGCLLFAVVVVVETITHSNYPLANSQHRGVCNTVACVEHDFALAAAEECSIPFVRLFTASFSFFFARATFTTICTLSLACSLAHLQKETRSDSSREMQQRHSDLTKESVVNEFPVSSADYDLSAAGMSALA
jgi:hypothetical protein